MVHAFAFFCDEVSFLLLGLCRCVFIHARSTGSKVDYSLCFSLVVTMGFQHKQSSHTANKLILTSENPVSCTTTSTKSTCGWHPSEPTSSPVFQNSKTRIFRIFRIHRIHRSHRNNISKAYGTTGMVPN